jgi:Mrp family chromosome partitioning ATPase
MGVKLVSFGFAGQGRAIMRGPMVSGVINQLLTTTEWYEFRKNIKNIEIKGHTLSM